MALWPERILHDRAKSNRARKSPLDDFGTPRRANRAGPFGEPGTDSPWSGASDELRSPARCLCFGRAPLRRYVVQESAYPWYQDNLLKWRCLRVPATTAALDLRPTALCYNARARYTSRPGLRAQMWLHFRVRRSAKALIEVELAPALSGPREVVEVHFQNRQCTRLVSPAAWNKHFSLGPNKESRARWLFGPSRRRRSTLRAKKRPWTRGSSLYWRFTAELEAVTDPA